MAFTGGTIIGGIVLATLFNNLVSLGFKQSWSYALLAVFSSISFLSIMSILSASAFADYLPDPNYLPHQNRFDYRVDLGNLDWFDRGLYKESLPYQPCIDLKEFYAYADSNHYDNLRRDDIKSYTYQLSYDDLSRLAAENPSDDITSNDFSNVEDLHCSSLPEYQRWRKDKPSFTDDDYFHLFGYESPRDYQERFDHYPVDDRLNYNGEYYNGEYFWGTAPYRHVGPANYGDSYFGNSDYRTSNYRDFDPGGLSSSYPESIGLARPDGEGAFASWVPFTWFESASREPASSLP